MVSAAAEITEIGLHRDMCYGSCPVYIVTLFRTGESRYEGEHFVDLVGPFVAPLDLEAFVELALAIAYLDFAGLSPRYAAEFTDAATTRTWVVSRGVRKEVEHYGGAGPDRLRQLEELIDEAASELAWRPAGSPETDVDAGASRRRDQSATGEGSHWTQRSAQFR